VKKLCEDIENDLRISTGTTTKTNPVKSGIKDVSNFLRLRPLRFYTMNFDIRAYVAHYLDTVFYNLNTVALFDWHIYGQMRNLAKEKYNLDLIEPHLPGQTLEQVHKERVTKCMCMFTEREK
jgi:WASH complex subunit 7